MTTTSSRTLQWIIIILIVTLISGGVYHYFTVRAAKINTSPTTLNTSGLVGYWTFDGADTPWTSTTAATTLDTSGQNNTGTLTNMSQSTSPTIGKIGQGLNFDGSNDYVNVGTSLDFTSPFTMTAWIKPKTVSTGVSVYDGDNIIHKGGAASDPPYNKQLTLFGTNELGWFSETASTNYVVITTGDAIIVNTWQLVTAVYNGTNMTLYVNGIAKGGPTAIEAPSAGSENVYLGGQTGGLGTSFDGTIDDVRIYNRALSIAEVEDLYRMGTATVNASTNALNTSGLVGQWSFDGKQTVWTSSTAATTLDTSGQGNTGTLTNMSQSTSVTPGKIGQALTFDGTDDFVNMGNVNSFERTDQFSYGGWVYWTSDVAGGILAKMDASGGTPTYRGYDVILVNSADAVSPNSAKVHMINTWSTNAMAVLTPTNSMSRNVWKHVFVTYDGSSNVSGIKIYINGVSQTLTTQFNALSATIVNTVNLRIGGRYSGVSTVNAPFPGRIDDVRVYNRVLSTAEIADLYTMGTATVNASTNALNTNGLVGQWSLDGKQTVWTSSSAATTLDTSGNNNTGTLTNMSQSTSVTPGKIGQALSFDGSNDYVNIPDAASLRVGSPNFTFAAWIKPGTVSGCGLDSGPNCIVFNKENSYEWAISNTNKISWAIRNTSPGWAWANSGLTALSGEWTHFVITYNGSNIITYKNGGASTNSQAGNGNVDNTTYQNALRIGARNAPGAATSFFPGSIDDARIYNRALSAGEVATLYNAGR